VRHILIESVETLRKLSLIILLNPSTLHAFKRVANKKWRDVFCHLHVQCPISNLLEKIKLLHLFQNYFQKCLRISLRNIYRAFQTLQNKCGYIGRTWIIKKAKTCWPLGQRFIFCNGVNYSTLDMLAFLHKVIQPKQHERIYICYIDC